MEVIVVKKHDFLNFVEKYVTLKWKKESLCYYNYRYWICLGSLSKNSEYGKVLNMRALHCTVFWICKNTLWQSSEYILGSKYAVNNNNNNNNNTRKTGPAGKHFGVFSAMYS